MRNSRLLRYLVVGSTVTGAYSILALLLRSLRLDALVASGLAFLMIQPIAFLAHRRFTYPDARRHGWSRFAFLVCTGFLLTLAIMRMTIDAGLPFWAGLVVGWIVIPAANYLVSALWVFRTRSLLQIRPDDR
jgi:putative flippase GtrA